MGAHNARRKVVRRKETEQRATEQSLFAKTNNANWGVSHRAGKEYTQTDDDYDPEREEES